MRIEAMMRKSVKQNMHACFHQYAADVGDRNGSGSTDLN